MAETKFLTIAELEAGLSEIRRAPEDAGTLKMLVARPQRHERDVLESGQLDLELGLVGDNWKARGYYRGGPAKIEMQLTVMNSRAAMLVAATAERCPLAGDQLYVDLDLSETNLPPGTRLAIGEAVIEVTAEPHTGCKSFAARYGTDAVKFVNSREGKRLRLRGLNAMVVLAGAIRVGDVVRKVAN